MSDGLTSQIITIHILFIKEEYQGAMGLSCSVVKSIFFLKTICYFEFSELLSQALSNRSIHYAY